MIKAIYRMSDASNVVLRPSYVSLRNCFINFTTNVDFDELTIIGDNINSTTKEWVIGNLIYLKKTRTIFSNSNNAESFKLALNLALENDDNDVIYFVEDDYIHKPYSSKVLLEGLEISDYVSLYDHPDKYEELYAYGEDTIVYYTASTHWKRTISTPMTFACRVSTLKRDLDIILGSLENRTMTWSSKMFKDLHKKHNKKMVMTPLPSYATHGMTAWLAPLVNWGEVMSTSLLKTYN